MKWAAVQMKWTVVQAEWTRMATLRRVEMDPKKIPDSWGRKRSATLDACPLPNSEYVPPSLNSTRILLENDPVYLADHLREHCSPRFCSAS